MDYTAYEVEDFILDDSFRNFCVGNNEKDRRFWESWMENHPEKQALVNEAKQIYLLLNGNQTAEHFAEDRLHFEAAMQQHLTADASTPTGALTPEIELFPERNTTWKKILAFSAVAAAVAIIFVFYPSSTKPVEKDKVALQFNEKEMSNPGERKSFQLPDGSKVMLNAGSTINISKNFNNTCREITLSGEAFFDVAHNDKKPFIIHTTAMDVKVLGTVFNVKAYPSDKLSETSLIKGSVEVTIRNEDNKKVLLKPNQKIVLPNITGKEIVPVASNKKTIGEIVHFAIKGLTYDKTDSTLAEVSWTENRLMFTDNSFEEIAAELQRWYNISIAFADDKVKQYRFTAVFDQKNIVQVLDALQLSRRFEYKIEENNKIIISR